MSENERADGETPDGTAAEGDPATDGAAEDGERATRETEVGVGTDEELRERVAEADPEELAREIAALRERAEDAEERSDELESKLKRKQADFQNFKKRQQRKLEDQQRRATEDLVERLLDVRDNLVRALDQDEDADIRPGVEKTLDQFDRVLDAEDVRTIDPGPGEAVDPERHEVLMRVDSEQPAGTVEGVHRPGYEMGDRVLRPAQVTVAEE
ncbi:MAG: nucleotide exchange factor GrpE [Haloarculaceae archaeon]